MLVFIIIGYLTCSFLAWGFTLGSFTKSFAYFKNTGVATFTALCGPLGLFVALACSLLDKSVTWRVIPLSKEQRWKIFEKEYKFLGRDYFNYIHG